MNEGIILLVLLFFAALMGAFYFALKSRKISTELLSTGATMLEGIQGTADALADATGNAAVSIAAYVLQVAAKAARAAEQMAKTGEIGKEERNAKAKQIAQELLEMAGIEVTDDRRTAIAVLLEAECDTMGHRLGLEALGGTEDEDAALAGAKHAKPSIDQEAQAVMELRAVNADIANGEGR